VTEARAQVLRFGPFVLDVEEHSLTRAGTPIPLAPKSFELLRVLAASGGRLLTKDALMKAVWPDTVVEEGNLSKGIFLLRQALGTGPDDRSFIETVPRVGYRFLAAGLPPSASHPNPPAAPHAEQPEAAAIPETQYAKSGDVHIAYQVAGNAGPDLVLVPGWVSHVEYAWEDPTFSRFLRRLAAFSRLIILDRRGTGLSDRARDLPSIEQQADDVRAVMDAAGSKQATLFGVSEGGPMCMRFATTYPDRTRALILFGTSACWMRTPDYASGIPQETLDGFIAQVVAGWGTGVSADLFAPSVATEPAFRKSWARFERFAVSPAGIQTLLRRLFALDIRHLLPSIRVPTLVLHRERDQAVRAANGRHLAEHISGARYVEIPGGDHFPFVGDVGRITDEVGAFLLQQAAR
jgi:pimeloyl-ACP methyl ester carboxylesterase